ncbi:MAG: hypothetical protein WCH34_15360 [Bacteroidota bacterium]
MSYRYQVAVRESGSDKFQSSYVYKEINNDSRWQTNWPFDEVYMSAENHFTTFSFSKNVEVKITLPVRTKISNVVVRPLSKNLKATISGNTITIPMDKPANIYVEIDGEERYPLFIFANPLEINAPAPDAKDTNIIYFGPGIHDVGYEKGPMQSIPVGKTVYLAGGAFVKGRFKTTGVAGTTTFRGRGILSGINIPGYSTYRGMIDANIGSVNVEGITILDAPQGYQGIIAYGNGSVVDNVKMLSWAMESDSGVLGANSILQNCLFKICDDALKPYREGMLLKDNVVWLQMCGSAILLGWNSIEQGINPVISGLDIIACDRGVKTKPDGTHQAIINLKNSNGATYKNIVIENVRVEKKPHNLIGIDIKQTDPNWVKNPKFNMGLGSIDGLTFRNITVSDMPSILSFFNGNGEVTPTSRGDIKNVTFENVKVAGTLITKDNADKYMTRAGNTSNFVFK